ncbi:MAG: VanZ family protein, partial [Actinobacteria bacterium]|nr:VanZ family protein [Actinomycetota bacterium]
MKHHVSGDVEVMNTTCSPNGYPSASTGSRWRFAWAALYCFLLLSWLALIALASTDIASETHTDVWLREVLRLFSPDRLGGDPSLNDISALSWAVRKLAHLLEYSVLGLLAAQSLRSFCPGYARGPARTALARTAAVVLPFGILAAALDEWHQTFLRSRTGAFRDVLFDLAGVSIGVLAAWLLERRATRMPSVDR